MKYITESIKIAITENPLDAKKIVAQKLGLKLSGLHSCMLHKQSIDARKRNEIHYVCRYIVDVDDSLTLPLKQYESPNDLLSDVKQATNAKNIVIVGSGPCGLMAGRLLSEMGHHVTMIERGGDIEDRQKSVNNFFEKGELDVNSNVQYGLGGAGTFSDGKLTSGISSPYTFTVFNEFARQGAPSEIMYSSTPHIGTDKLVGVVANMRNSISSYGGKWLFNSTMTELLIKNNAVSGVKVKNNFTNDIEIVPCDAVILAVGHSARDTVEMLNNVIDIEPKPFAIGVRVEHPREMISMARYGELSCTHRDLQSANYKMALNLPNGRNCYTFCMCPGGYVVPASSELDTVVVNGMSNYDRLAENSNSALVVGVKVDDYYKSSVLDGIEWQRSIEHKAYDEVNQVGEHVYMAPAQNVVDFLNKVPSSELEMQSSYSRGVYPCNLWDVLPAFVAESLSSGIKHFERTIKGFSTSGILIAPETRTSSPVKIVRGENLSTPKLANLYPAGEGAGYAGGIVSAGVDGLRVALAVAEQLKG